MVRFWPSPMMTGYGIKTSEKTGKHRAEAGYRAERYREAAEVLWQFRSMIGGADLRVIPGGNQVDGLPPAPSDSQSCTYFP